MKQMGIISIAILLGAWFVIEQGRRRREKEYDQFHLEIEQDEAVEAAKRILAESVRK